MPSKVLIRIQSGGVYQWWRHGPGSDAQNGVGEGSLEDLRAALGPARYELCLLLPGDKVNTRLESIAYRERSHIRHALPFQMEDSLLGDIDELHFAFGVAARINDTDGLAAVPVAWCERQWLRDTLHAFVEAGLELQHAIPEALVLPAGQGWALHLEGLLHCHIAPGYGFSVDPALAPAVLNLLLEEQGAPAGLRLSASNTAGLEQIEGCLPLELHCEKSSQVQEFWQAPERYIQSGVQSILPVELDLLQGEFARRLPVARWWRQWRSVAALAGVALTAWLASQALYIHQQKSEQQLLQARIEAAFRSVVPEGVMVDAEKQLRNRLTALGGDGNYKGPIELLARIAPLLVEDQDILVRGLSYNMRQGDMRLNCRADSFTGIEQLHTRMSVAGLDAELVHSSADGDGQQARFRLAWAQP